jgi:hypothetical protein
MGAAGRKSLSFEGLLADAYVLALADSGATHSFASLDSLHTHYTSLDPVSVPAARLANGSSLGIKGITRLIEVKIGPFRFKHRFLVVEMDAQEFVLGMSFLHQVNPEFDWRERTMTVLHKQTSLTLHAADDESLPVMDSRCIELCTLKAVSKRSLSEAAIAEAFAGSVIPELCIMHDAEGSEDPLFSGPGWRLPEIQPILHELRDVLVPEVPAGLPPERLDVAGNPFEHCIDVDPSAK